ncbi:hypothetical protein WMY93_000229 [Mugilogobius chulae]|uniref:Uncharacterized protein n=1 Tax=Mugilogobius chulae TaxID=88201 RepID=A0AAW0Q0A2_9GOBI
MDLIRGSGHTHRLQINSAACVGPVLVRAARIGPGQQGGVEKCRMHHIQSPLVGDHTEAEMYTGGSQGTGLMWLWQTTR